MRIWFSRQHRATVELLSLLPDLRAIICALTLDAARMLAVTSSAVLQNVHVIQDLAVLVVRCA